MRYNWHRHYDPSLGCYTQPNPLGFVDGPSVYGYAGGSPYGYVDPDGRQARKDPRSKKEDCQPEDWQECANRCKPRPVEACYVEKIAKLRSTLNSRLPGGRLYVTVRKVECNSGTLRTLQCRPFLRRQINALRRTARQSLFPSTIQA